MLHLVRQGELIQAESNEQSLKHFILSLGILCMISPFCSVLKCEFNHSEVTVFSYLCVVVSFFVCLRSKKRNLVLPIAESVCDYILLGFLQFFCLLSYSKYHSTEQNHEVFFCLKYFILGYFSVCRSCLMGYVYQQLNMIHMRV